MGIPTDHDSELRNRIYDFVVLSDKGTHPKRVPLSRDGNYAALTRVCRQIRTEYLPIQRAAADVAFDWYDLRMADTYLSTFYSDEGCGGTHIDPHIVTIDSKQPYVSCRANTQDILPLVKFHHAHLHTQIQFQPFQSLDEMEDTSIQHYYRDGLLKVTYHNRRDWLRDLQQGNVQKIVIVLDAERCMMGCIFVAKGVLRRRQLPTMAYDIDVYGFCKGLKLTVMESNPVDIEWFKRVGI